MDDTLDLDELRRLYDATTSGNWGAAKSTTWLLDTFGSYTSGGIAALYIKFGGSARLLGEGFDNVEDARFAAIVHNVFPALLSELTSTRAALATVESDRDRARRWAAKWKHAAKEIYSQACKLSDACNRAEASLAADIGLVNDMSTALSVITTRAEQAGAKYNALLADRDRWEDVARTEHMYTQAAEAQAEQAEAALAVAAARSEQLQAQVVRLASYADHRRGCPVSPCTCGFHAALVSEEQSE